MHKKSRDGNYKSAAKKVLQQQVPLFAKNAFRMKLHPFQIPLTVANPHNFPGFAPGRHLKTGGQRGGIDNQRMVAGNR
jgi:hypothetical protein